MLLLLCVQIITLLNILHGCIFVSLRFTVRDVVLVRVGERVRFGWRLGLSLNDTVGIRVNVGFHVKILWSKLVD